MNIFGIGLPEMAVIAAIGLLVFGPKRLPELGRTLGRTIRGFQSASQEFEKEFRGAIASADTAPIDTASIATASIDSAASTPPAAGMSAAPAPAAPEGGPAAPGA